MNIVRTASAASATVTLTEMKTHLRVTSSDEDTYIAALESAAVQWCENYCNRSFVTQTWQAKIDYTFPTKTPGASYQAILIPMGDLVSLTSIQYYDAQNELQTLSSSLYTVDRHAGMIRIMPAYSEAWPVTAWRVGAVIVTFTAGYGTASDVPELIKSAIKLLVGEWYENREAIVVGTIVADTPFAVRAILGQYQILDVVPS